MSRLFTELGGAVVAAVLLVYTGACSPVAPAESGPDAGESGGDGSVSDGSGIRLVFDAVPAPGESFTGSGSVITVTSARFFVADLRLIGDSAAGDVRTRKSLVDLSWISADPITVSYDQAPPGLYSRTRGNVVAFSMTGRVSVGSSPSLPFEVERESSALSFEFDLNKSFEAGEGLTVRVDLDLQRILQDVQFGTLPYEDGVLEVESGSSAMAGIELNITKAFGVGVD